jgi:hypothetical protein
MHTPGTVAVPVIPATWEVEAGPSKRVSETTFHPTNWAHMEMCVCHLSYLGSINRKIEVHASDTGENAEPFSEK